ncbi:hypothetical protein GCM10009801_16990 [Streptomyces albiaxialis]|uniref:Secreted protein n=1 Tax=Streptomyces albiaxialis TaxID=329523 RepID=A0ABN2VQH2_9ACTN
MPTLAACSDLSSVGLSALVMSSARALTAVTPAGAVYPVWPRVTTWRAADRRAEGTRRRRSRLPWSRCGNFGQGLWSNVLAPPVDVRGLRGPYSTRHPTVRRATSRLAGTVSDAVGLINFWRLG